MYFPLILSGTVGRNILLGFLSNPVKREQKGWDEWLVLEKRKQAAYLQSIPYQSGPLGPWATRENNRISFCLWQDTWPRGRKQADVEGVRGNTMRGNYNKDQSRMHVKKPGGNTETTPDANMARVCDMIVHCRSQCRTKEGWNIDARRPTIWNYCSTWTFQKLNWSRKKDAREMLN